jgi:uncharacterized protein (TIGR00297 family)
MLIRFILGICLSSFIGIFAYRRQSLSRSGALGAVLSGTITFTAGLNWAAVLLIFFFSSTFLSKLENKEKSAARTQFSKGEQRDFWQVFANGGAAVGITALFLLTEDKLLWVLYLAGFATANADTWATEIGTFVGGKPRLITNFKPVPPGASGGISAAGTMAAVLGAALIGFVGALLRSDSDQNFLGILGITLLVGFIGALADSFFGATIQGLYECEGMLTEKSICDDGRPAKLRHGLPWVNNDTVNFAATLVGIGVAFLLTTII